MPYRSIYYMDKTTGELLTYAEMRESWRNDYDGDDPTNPLHWSEQFEVALDSAGNAIKIR